MAEDQHANQDSSYSTKRDKRNARIAWATLIALVLVGLGVTWGLRHKPTTHKRPAKPLDKPAVRVLKPAETTAVLAAKKREPEKAWHPPHQLKVWMATHKGRTFRVIQLPRCEHLETVVTYDPRGQTREQAKLRNGGVAACTGSFHNPGTMALADFFQKDGRILACARTGRSFILVDSTGKLDISCAYASVKGNKDYTAIALGQRLVPLQYDGFSVAFMNKLTDRMAVGLNNNFIFIVQGKSDIWRLADFMQTKLPVGSAINCDGGHVVRGKAPVHLVFRWKKHGAGGPSG